MEVLSGLDFAIIGGFLIYAIISGLRSKDQASQNLEEYFLAGRSIPGWKAGVSMAATQFAADTPLNVMGMIAIAGVFSLWQLWIYALAFLLLGFVLASSWRRAGVITDAELTEIRYGKKPAAALRGIKAVYFGLIFNCAVLAMVFFAAAKVAEPFLPWHLWLPEAFFSPLVSLVQWVGTPLNIGGMEDPLVWQKTAGNFFSILVIIAVTMMYSSTGGLRAVIATDVFQFFIMMLGTGLFAYFVVDKVGGFGAMTDKIRVMFADGGPGGITPDQILAFTPWDAKDVSFALLSVFALQWLIQMNSDGTGYLAQRSMACKSEKDAKVAAIVFTICQIFLRSLLWLPIGLGLLILFEPNLALPIETLKANREATFVRGIAELLPAGLMGLMVTGMLAALASTVDTHLNWGSSYFTNDIYKRFICKHFLKKEPSAGSLVWVARFCNLAIILVSLLVMTRLSSINEAWQLSLMLGSGMGVVLLLRWFWWRMNAWAEIAAIVASLVVAPILLFFSPVEHEATRLIVVAIVSTVAALAAIYHFGPEEKEQLQAFVKKVNPPGFWGGVDKAGDTTRVASLWTGLAATALCAFSIFNLLVGIGSWMIDSPVPGWFPGDATAWITTLIVLGTAAIPGWLYLGFSSKKKWQVKMKAERPTVGTELGQYS